MNILKTFYYDTEEIKPDNETQIKDLEKIKKVVTNTASKLYDKLLSIYTTQYNKLSEDSTKKIIVLNKPEMLIFDFDEDDLPPMLPLEDDEEVKIEQEETIAERIKLNPRKRKLTETG